MPCVIRTPTSRNEDRGTELPVCHPHAEVENEDSGATPVLDHPPLGGVGASQNNHIDWKVVSWMPLGAAIIAPATSHTRPPTESRSAPAMPFEHLVEAVQSEVSLVQLCEGGRELHLDVL